MSTPQPVRHGMFIMPFHPPEKPLAQGYDEDLELIVRAEELGFEEFWIGEHHTMKYETIVSPEMFIARALGETNTIRMGPAPVCLNLHHPAAVASRLAFLDHLSKGRLNLCFGNGSVTADQELYGVDPKLGGRMAREAIDCILKLWATDPPYEHNGEFWQFRLADNVDEETLIGFIHKPYQQPLPPIVIPAMSRKSFSMQMAGERGYEPFSHCLITGNVVAEHWKTYSEAAQSAGREADRANWRIGRSIFLADTTQQAEELARTNSLGQNYEYIGRLFDKGLGRAMYKRDLDMPDSECNLDFLMTEQIIAGDVDTCLKRLLDLWEETGGFGKLILMSYDWDNREAWLRSMELFVNELMPAFNKAVSGVAV